MSEGLLSFIKRKTGVKSKDKKQKSTSKKSKDLDTKLILERLDILEHKIFFELKQLRHDYATSLTTPKGERTPEINNAKEELFKLLSKGVKVSEKEFLSKHNISRASFYIIKKEIKFELKH